MYAGKKISDLLVVARPDKPVQELLNDLGLELPTDPKMIQNVVSKNDT